MHLSFSPEYEIPLPERHPFPMAKFSALRDLLLAEGLACAEDIVTPEPMPWDELRLAHSERYLRALATGTLTDAEERRLGLPWSPALVRRSRLAVTGTLLAMRAALRDGIAANLAGGTHHACPDHGEGFCVLNDVAIGLRVLRREERLRRALVVDLDVHHGNGNALAFGPEAPEHGEILTFSMHGAKNFPVRKPPSSRDVGLPDGTGDEDYLAALATHLPEMLDLARPELVVYLAGVDPRAGDRYGRLALTLDGLARRDEMVLTASRERGVPIVLLLSGGYAPTAVETAELHAIVHRAAAGVYGASAL